MGVVVSSKQLNNGLTTKRNTLGPLIQPVQFLKDKEKDDDWKADNMDWLESLGLKQVLRNAPRLMKNSKAANGIIDKSDYVIEEDNEMSEMIDMLAADPLNDSNDNAFELKNFPIISNVINILVGEFAKRSDKISYRATDDLSHNEMLDMKMKEIEQVLIGDAEQKMQMKIQQLGIDLDTEEGQQQAQQMMAPENLKSLPEIEQFFTKDYRSMYELWAAHQAEYDHERFHLAEQETIGFRDSLVYDREFWGFEMYEDDYDLKLWNPIMTFYHKSPEVRYVSEGNHCGKFDLMTPADIIDKYGHMMNKKQLESLGSISVATGAGYNLNGVQNDGAYYDSSRTKEWNQEGASLGMRQFESFNNTYGGLGNNTSIDSILNETEDLIDFGNESMFRVTTAYWKTQKMVGHLTSIGDDMLPFHTIVDETFVVTTKPIYDNSVNKEKSEDTLIYGEHIEWIWINETYGGLKIGQNKFVNIPLSHDKDVFDPIYLNVGRVKYQFKGDYSIYGCKLPVEGAVFTDRNSISRSLVDKMKPYQIGFNLVNNQIADILIDELGSVIVLDQNALPKRSMGEDWGPNNFNKAFVAMKDFQMLPLDTAISNTENATNFQHYQVLNMEQTNRLLGRVQLANHFRMQCLDSVGVSPQRAGAVNAQETATGIEQAINMSYSQTEIYFTQHSEYLMPRVHQMRTDLSQHYQSNNPSIKLQYVTSMDEKVNFAINGDQLKGKDIGVFATTKINEKAIKEQIKNIALNNNTTGATIFDLGDIIKADSLAEITTVMKGIEDKALKRTEQERQHAELLQQQQIQAASEMKDKELQLEANESQLERDKDILVAKIRASSLTGMNDRNENNQNDYIDTLEYLDKKALDDTKVSIERDKETNKKISEQKKINLEREKLRSKEKIADKQLQVAKENVSKSELKARGKKV